MESNESSGECNTHGSYEVCGHTTETCPDNAAGRSIEGKAGGGEVKSDKALESLQERFDIVEKNIAFAPIVGSLIVDGVFRQEILDQAKEDGINADVLAGFLTKLEDLKQRAAVAEINDALHRAEELGEEGNVEGVRNWWAAASSKLEKLGGRISAEDMLRFKSRLQKVYDLLK